ncbi:MAG: glycoside hydrolase domain-containing protein [bacterium]
MFGKRSRKGWCYGFVGMLAWLGGLSATGAEGPFEFRAVSDMVRVFEDGYGLAPSQKAVEIFGLRNETVSAQCFIQAGEDLQGVEISISPLLHTDPAYSLPPENVRWNFVGSIFIPKNTSKLNKTDLTRAAPARFPDFLSEEKQMALRKGEYKAVYITIAIPPQAESGLYKGTITASSVQGSRALPIELTVYPLALPEERHLQVTEWYSIGNFKKFHGIERGDSEEFYKMLALYAENMAAHRQNVFRLDLGLIAAARDAQGRLRFDFSKFDRWAEVFWNTGKMDRLETGFVARFGEGDWSSRTITLRDFSVRNETGQKVESMPGNEFLPQFLPAFEQHLREKGWLDKTLFHIADEPSNHNIMDWREASDFVRRHAPSLKRMDAIETPHCQGRLEVWVPKLDHLATFFDAYRQAQEQGNEMWFYTVGIFQGGSFPNKTVDVALIESRVLHWLNYRYGLTGYLHWGFNHWTEDPFEAPGQHNGDGWHVYPTQNGLLDSLRWEQMRNGIQDYEALWLLEDKTRRILQTLGDRFFMFDPARRGREIASRVVKNLHEFTRDLAALTAAKKQVIEEIWDLDRKPVVLVQTNPAEGTPVARDCAIDLVGYAEPGARIQVNGEELPVSPDGLFMENVSLSKEFTIVVEAEHPNGKKTIIRRFENINRGKMD